MVEEYLSSLADDMNGCIEHLKKELATVRTGRASPVLLEGVTVVVHSYGGSNMPLKQLASVQAPDARLLVVTPWDKSTLTDIERAIGAAGLGLNPSNDGQIIRVPVPALTGERRKELTKLVSKYAEEARVRVRGVRKEYNDIFKGMFNDKDITEDDLDKAQAKVQKATDDAVTKVDQLAAAKDKEILEV